MLPKDFHNIYSGQISVSQLKMLKSMLIRLEENENKINSRVLRRRQDEDGNEVQLFTFCTWHFSLARFQVE